MRIHRLDQLNLPGSAPFLQALFPLDGFRKRSKKVIIDQQLQIEFTCESFELTVPMLPCPVDYVRGHSNVQSTVRLVAHNVDTGLLFHQVNFSCLGEEGKRLMWGIGVGRCLLEDLGREAVLG